MNENFRDKNFVIATFFRDFCRVAARARADNSRYRPAHNCTCLAFC